MCFLQLLNDEEEVYAEAAADQGEPFVRTRLPVPDPDPQWQRMSILVPDERVREAFERFRVARRKTAGWPYAPEAVALSDSGAEAALRDLHQAARDYICGPEEPGRRRQRAFFKQRSN